jgi:DNA-directed RNA polymerase subunit H (RpoH/RPB5)
VNREKKTEPEEDSKIKPVDLPRIQTNAVSNSYGRIKVGGRVIRESPKTDVWTTAMLRLTDSLKEHQAARSKQP